MIRQLRSESGAAVIEFIWLVLLLLIPLGYLLLLVFDAQRVAFAVSTAARSATRAAATAPSEGEVLARAKLAVQLAFQDQNLPANYQIKLRCSPSPANCLQANSKIIIQVKSQVSFGFIPTQLGQHAGFPVSATQVSYYGNYRVDR